jgi:hypothetical protein
MNSATSETVTAYPLQWPVGWKRTDYYRIQRSQFGDRSVAKAREFVFNQVRLMGGRDLIVSSNLELRNDGLPRSSQRQPTDKGVAIYFKYKSKPMCFACDKWNAVEDNLWSIGRTVEALRQIERDGSSDMLERAFTGFAALPAPAGMNWWDVLGVQATATAEEIKDAFRSLAKQNHPDTGGDGEKFLVIQKAYEAAMQSRG